MFQTRKCLKQRSAARTGAASRELEKSGKNSFNTLLEPELFNQRQSCAESNAPFAAAQVAPEGA